MVNQGSPSQVTGHPKLEININVVQILATVSNVNHPKNLEQQGRCIEASTGKLPDRG
jgi:hypothetical protein